MNKLAQILEKWVKIPILLMSRVDIIVLLGMMMLMVTDVILRLIANYSIPGVFELVEFSMLLLIYLGLASTQTSKMNISVSFFVDKMPQKAQAVIDLVNFLISLFIASLIVWRGLVFLKHVWISGRDSDVLNIPVFYFQFFLVVGWSLLVLALLIDILKHILNWFKK
jgi:TRAP-type C4-dicarboxylate transport system permease small subunit